RGAITDAPSLIHRRQRTTLTANERVARESLPQHPVEAHQGALRIVAARHVQRVTRAVKRIDAVLAGPKIELTAAGAQHAHAQTAVLFEIMRNPAFLFAPRRKNAAGDGVADNDVPITA